jgi:hypothetical protein
LAFVATVALFLPGVRGSEPSSKPAFPQKVEPVLQEFCYDCHGDGEKKGKVSFDEFKSHEELLGQRDLWLAVLKNVRAGLMPPEKKARPSAEQKKALEDWIKQDVFGIDYNDPDPGRVTIRRLNRVEYRNTIRDLMGFDFKVEEELPPDDTGYGFDNIGDVLTVSPMLLEKYMQAAETIVSGAVPRVPMVVVQQAIPITAFTTSEGIPATERLSFYDELAVSHPWTVQHTGTYRVVLELAVNGKFEFDPGRCRLVLKVDNEEVWEDEFGWGDSNKARYEVEQSWTAGEHSIALELHPLVSPEEKQNSLDLRVLGFAVEGPLEQEHWVRPKNFDLFFTRDVPATPGERQRYAEEILSRFATKAFRRPIKPALLERLVALSQSTAAEPGRSFEDGIAQAMLPVLASPRFLFRVEEAIPTDPGHPLVDEYGLASRLSYFLWSTMPDEELFSVAERGDLRKDLAAQVRRMLASPRSNALIENFVGQWLQVRDIAGIDINARAVLTRDAGQERETLRTRTRFEELRAKKELTPEEAAEREEIIQNFRRRGRNRSTVELDGELRRALRQESEMTFGYVVKEDRSVLELIDSDYTFLNERLVKHYALTDLPGMADVVGPEMRLVHLPAENVRGGVLTQGSVLIATSNPTRTSPVKRGLFVLDNILGMPPPPPPPNIPNLEQAEGEFKDREPTLRESLEVHRRDALCSSCHNRMDPLGLALENFNALGMWREKERNQSIDASGKLISGEAFQDIREIKRVLVANHRREFYQCLTEKLLTYALGRGLEYYDVHSVDQIVERLEKEEGRFSALLMGVIESAPFRKRRSPDAARDLEPPQGLEHEAKMKNH